MKPFIAFLFMISLTFSSIAQKKISHSIGATITLIDGNAHIPYTYEEGHYEQKVSIMQSSATYFPRYNLMENEKSSISVGIPVSLGVGLYRDLFYEEDPRIGFSYDLPVAFDYNLGLQSSESNESGFGGYVGVGFGYQGVSISGNESSKLKVNTYGPIARAGVRFGRSNPITIGFQYKKGLEKEKFRSMGVVVLYHL